MSHDRNEDQKQLGCLSASLLVHGLIGATIALAPLANAKKEQPTAVFLAEAKEIPKAEQQKTLPPAPQTKQEIEPLKPENAEAPKAEPAPEIVKVKDAVKAAKTEKKIATTLPQKK